MSAEDTMPQGNPSDVDPSCPIHGEMELEHEQYTRDAGKVEVYVCTRDSCTNSERVPREEST